MSLENHTVLKLNYKIKYFNKIKYKYNYMDNTADKKDNNKPIFTNTGVKLSKMSLGITHRTKY